MLDTSEKLLERLLKPHLSAAIENGGGLSARQNVALREVTEASTVTQRGSRCSRPVLLLATLDVKNTLNSLKWNDVLNALENSFSVPRYILTMISTYLSNRQLVITQARDQGVKLITSVAAQGSILGPDP